MDTPEAEVAREKSQVSVDSKLEITEQFQICFPRIYAYLRYRVDILEDAEDLVSIVFERAFTRYSQFDSTKGHFSTWLFQIAHNTLANYYRNRERQAQWRTDTEPPVDLVASEALPEEAVMKQEGIRQLLHGIATLNERDQEIISLKFAGRLSNKEIGEIMELKEKTVSVVLLRAMRRLKQQLEKEAAR